MSNIGSIIGSISALGLMIAILLSFATMGLAPLLVYVFLFGLILSNFLLEN